MLKAEQPTKRSQLDFLPELVTKCKKNNIKEKNTHTHKS
jgi:hypothetical protein